MHCAICDNKHKSAVETCEGCGEASWHPEVNGLEFTPMGILPIGESAGLVAEMQAAPRTVVVSQALPEDGADEASDGASAPAAAKSKKGAKPR